LFYIQISIVIDEFDPQNMQEILASIVKHIIGAADQNCHFAPGEALSAE